MTTSQRTWKMRVDSNLEERLSPGDKAYFRMRAKGKIYDAMMRRFMAMRREGLTKAKLSKKIGCRPEQVTRWLSTPGNMTIESLSDLLLAMGAEVEVTVVALDGMDHLPPEGGVTKVAPASGGDVLSSTSETKVVPMREAA